MPAARRAGRGARRHLLARRPGRGRLRRRRWRALLAGAPVPRDPPAVARHDGRRLRRLRRGRVPVDVGGLRQPADRGGHPPAPGRRRAATRSPTSCGRSGFRWFDPARPRRPRRVPPRTRTRRCTTTTPPCARAHFGLDRLADDLAGSSMRQAGSRDRRRRPSTRCASGAPASPGSSRSASASATGCSSSPSCCSSSGFAAGFDGAVGTDDHRLPGRRVARARAGHRVRLRA